jgi:hypothetical protein
MNGKKPFTAPSWLSQLDDQELREMARMAIRSGKLPDRLPERSWGVQGASACCSVCGIGLLSHEAALEIEFPTIEGACETESKHLHARCFAAWGAEVRGPRFPNLPGSASGAKMPARAFGSADERESA